MAWRTVPRTNQLEVRATAYFDENLSSVLTFRYILRLFGWARKYGLRINLDLHTWCVILLIWGAMAYLSTSFSPGSQNGVTSMNMFLSLDFNSILRV